MSFIDIDRAISHIHVAKTSAVIEILWRQHEGRVLYGAAHDSAAYFASRFAPLWLPTLKVGFVRNPWAMWPSFYHWYGYDGGEHAYMQPGGPHYATFREFLLRRAEWRPNLATAAQWPMLCDANQGLLIDKVLRTERLQEEFDWLCEMTGFPKQRLPSKPERRNYLDYYDDELRGIVAEISEADIRLFGYQFGDTG